MNKKILMASFFAAVMLMVPFGPVASAPSGELEDFSQNVVGSIYVIPDYILEELYDLIDILLLYLGNNPEIVAICNQLLEIITNDIHDTICNLLLTPIYYLLLLIFDLFSDYETFLGLVIYVLLLDYVGSLFYFILETFNCEDWEPPAGMILSTLQENLDMVQGQTVECPCIQQNAQSLSN